MVWQYSVSKAGADSDILKMGGALCLPPWLDDEENFRFQMVLKKILAKYFFQYFQIFSIFISNESLPWNLTNFSKFTNAFIKKEIKHSHSSQWEKNNWEKLDF